MKTLWALLLFAVPLFGQATNPICNGSPLSTAQTCTIGNTNGAFSGVVHVTPKGSPSGVTVTVKGCSNATSTCDTAANTCSSSSISTCTDSSTSEAWMYVTLSAPYDYLLVTATLTGGTTPTVSIDPRLSTANSHSGGSSYSATSPIVLTGTVFSCPTCGTGTGNVSTSGTITSGQIAVWASSTAIKSVAVSGDGTLSSGGVLTNTGLNGTSLSGLATGLLKNTTGTGVPSIAVAGTDYQAPLTLPLSSANGGSGVANTATHTLGTSNQNWATLGTGIVKNTTTTGALSNAASSDVIGLFLSCSGTQYLGADGSCHTSASGTVTSVSVTTANGVSGTVATATTTPAISLSLGAITPSKVTVTDTAANTDLSLSNSTPATSGTWNSSPIASLGGTYFNGSASFPDTWTAQNVVGILGSYTNSTCAENSSSVVTLTISGTGQVPPPGEAAALSGFSTCTWLNGQQPTTSTSSYNAGTFTFTDSTSHGTQSSVSDAGTVKLLGSLLNIAHAGSNIAGSSLVIPYNLNTPTLTVAGTGYGFGMSNISTQMALFSGSNGAITWYACPNSSPGALCQEGGTISSTGGQMDINAASNTPVGIVAGITTSTSNAVFEVTGGTLSATSGTQVMLHVGNGSTLGGGSWAPASGAPILISTFINPDINPTNGVTGSYTALGVYPYIQNAASLSGNYLFAAGTASASSQSATLTNEFTIDPSGNTVAQGGSTQTSVTDSGLTSGRCVQASTGGLLGSSASPCGAALSSATGTATYTPGANVTSVACASGYLCNNSRGTLTLVGGTATTGTIATVSFSTTLSAPPACFAWMNGGGTFFGIGNSAPSTTAFNITAAISVATATVTINYICQT